MKIFFYTISGIVYALYSPNSENQIGGYERFETNILLNPSKNYELNLYDYDNFRQFVGGGFRIIYQKVFGAILRVDYGIDIYNRQDKGFVIGLGQYF
jgi:hypothetical protein